MAETQKNPLELSDADLLNVSMEDYGTVQDTVEQDEEIEQETEVNAESEDNVEQSSDSEDQEEPDNQETSSDRSADEDSSTVGNNVSVEADNSQQGSTLSYEAEYKKLLAPFKANGKEMQVRNVEDARLLMQMGANYNKKMAGMKPSLKILKALESNGLLDQERINFLIDLHKKEPTAVAKFLQESEIDPMDVDLASSTAYKPGSHIVSDKEIELDEVLDEIRPTETFQRTIDELTNKWDADSKRVFLDQPQLIKVLNDHMSQGIYDQIMQTVEQERMFGRLRGMSDLDAYKAVGDAIQARGGFGKPMPASKQQQEAQVKDRKRAATPTKAGAPKAPTPEFNPLSLSDAEFEKFSAERFG